MEWVTQLYVSVRWKLWFQKDKMQEVSSEKNEHEKFTSYLRALQLTFGILSSTEGLVTLSLDVLIDEVISLQWGFDPTSRKPGGKERPGGELRHRTALATDLFNLTTSKGRVAEPKQSGVGTSRFLSPGPNQSHIRHHFVNWGKGSCRKDYRNLYAC